MATKKDVQSQINKSYEAMLGLEKIHLSNLTTTSTAEEKISVALDMQADKIRMINELRANENKLTEDQKKLLADLDKEYAQQIVELKKLNAEVKQQAKNQDAVNKKVEKYSQALAKGWEYLMQSDKVIKETIRSLGMSGAKADAMRKSFELSAGHVARMGGGMADIQNVMQGYADETGRARALTGEMVEDITAIGLGTGLGVEQATRLGAQFELMGLDARRSMDYVQGIVDTSERMGVNTTKVLKNISDNFKKLNTYTFQGGTKAMAQMAMNAEKMKVDMSDALSAADAAKGLEKAIDLAANLQVMGGEFAKTDPFEWMYLARNEPDKLTKKISEMTRGMVTFRKNSEGTFEKFISPADRQRLESVAASLGISAEKMTEITQRRADLDKMARELSGTGLTDREKELVEGAAIFNAKSGKFEVQLAGRMKDISTLTEDQAKSFVKEQVTLQKRAELAQDFETAFKATLEELKASLLPMLRGINAVLAFIRPVAKAFGDAIGWLSRSDIGSALLKGAGALMAAGFLLSKVLAGFTSKGLGERIATRLSGGATEKTGGFSVGNLFRKKGTAAGESVLSSGGRAAGRNAGKGMMRGGAGIGAAAIGMGAGIGAAAAGISLLADSMSKLTPEQAKTLASIVQTLGWFVVGGALAAAAIMLLGGASTAASLGLLALGAAALMIGAGIGIAAAGIGYMAQGLTGLVTAGKDAGPAMLSMGAGIAAMGAGMMMFTAGALGLAIFAGTLRTISKNADAIAKVGNSFKEIHAVMSGSKDDFLAVERAVNAISGMNAKGGSIFADLANMMKQPLKVEFVDKNVAVVSNITLEIDGEKFFQKTYRPSAAISKQQEAKNGQGSSK